MRYAFVAEHRGQFSVRSMCRCLRVQEDARQTDLLKEAWVESGKVYGQRKLHDDLVEQGESICLNESVRPFVYD